MAIYQKITKTFVGQLMVIAEMGFWLALFDCRDNLAKKRMRML